MPRRARIAPDEIVYDVLNRANGRSELFHKPEDYSAFDRIMIAAMHRSPIRYTSFQTSHFPLCASLPFGRKLLLRSEKLHR